MANITLNDPIDGAELKSIILSRISSALGKDCTLADDIAYAGFSMTFEINLTYLRSKTAPTVIWGGEGHIAEGARGELAQQPFETIIDTYATDSPNTAREEHALPVPVMVATPSGNVRKKIHVNPRSPR